MKRAISRSFLSKSKSWWGISKLKIYSYSNGEYQNNYISLLKKQKYYTSSLLFSEDKNKSDNVELTSEAKKFKKDHIYSPDKIGHISFEDSGPDIQAKTGTAFVRYEYQGKSTLREANETEIKTSNVLLFGGLDFDTPLHMSALIKRFGEIQKFGNLKGMFSPIAISPEVSKKERYKAALAYDQDPEYFPKYIEDRVKKFIIPKIEDETSIFNPYPPITLGGFSIGNREIGMMSNALKYILKGPQYNLSDKELTDLFSSFKTLGIGYAINPDSIKHIDFKKMIIFSLDDHGVLIPNKLNEIIEDIVSCPKLDQADHYVYTFPNNNGVDHGLIFLGHGMTPDRVQGKVIHNDHGLPQYVEGIKKLPVIIKQDLASYLTYEEQPILNHGTADTIILGEEYSPPN